MKAIRVDQLRQERETLIQYMGAKMRAEDWHGVCDAANDLREVEAELRGMTYLEGV